MLLDYEVALKTLLDDIELTLKTEKVSLLEASGRRLAVPVVAKYDTPSFDNSAMDGYALCDSTGERTEFPVVGRIMAGGSADFELKEGEAARIFTGAPTPKGATTVVIQEHTETETVGDQTVVKLTKPIAIGKNIRYQAEEIKAGDVLFEKDHYLDPAAIALCASQGAYELEVYSAVRTTVFSTGDELCEPWETLGANQIHDANRYQLLSWLKNDFNPCDGGILKDEYEALKAHLLAASKENDIILLSGGASVGEADFVSKAIRELGELMEWRLAIKPGKPFGWGKIGECYIFMLPGNPVSAYATFYVLVMPVLRKILGKSPRLPQMRAKIAFTKTRIEPRREFLRGTYYVDENGDYAVKAVEFQGSAMLSGLSHANCLIEMLPNQETREGEWVRIFPLDK